MPRTSLRLESTGRMSTISIRATPFPGATECTTQHVVIQLPGSSDILVHAEYEFEVLASSPDGIRFSGRLKSMSGTGLPPSEVLPVGYSAVVEATPTGRVTDVKYADRPSGVPSGLLEDIEKSLLGQLVVVPAEEVGLEGAWTTTVEQQRIGGQMVTLAHHSVAAVSDHDVELAVSASSELSRTRGGVVQRFVSEATGNIRLVRGGLVPQYVDIRSKRYELLAGGVRELVSESSFRATPCGTTGD